MLIIDQQLFVGEWAKTFVAAGLYSDDSLSDTFVQSWIIIFLS